MLATRATSEVRNLKAIVFLLRIAVSPEERRPEDASIDRRLVEDNRVLLVVASVAGDCHNSI